MKKITLITLFASVLSSGFANAKNSDIEHLNAASASLPFSQIVRVDNTLYMSGQIGLTSSGKLAQGGFAAETKQTLENIKSTLEQHNYSMKNIVKCTVMLTDINNFKMFNKIYAEYFTPPYPARSAFAVKALALNSVVEVECIGAV
ncbi:RidA family protein [Pseudoalteromonas sp. SG44-5]|nr:Rid family detoxifying hydrolase [Pseudoalteromonas sp. SG44-5]MBB1406851.1 RidA family protein [Pseudoalteromonas sp. SG44-5]MBH0094333.1 RidA family protein [Pseudoalteromonas sp. SCQQ13]